MKKALRKTSPGVVRPARAFSIPERRSGIMPSAIPWSLTSWPEAPAAISLRIYSLTERTSNTPVRPR